MLPKAYKDGTEIYSQQKVTGRIVWKSYWKAKNIRYADLQFHKN
jgi:hypothetical protein